MKSMKQILSILTVAVFVSAGLSTQTVKADYRGLAFGLAFSSIYACSYALEYKEKWDRATSKLPSVENVEKELSALIEQPRSKEITARLKKIAAEDKEKFGKEVLLGGFGFAFDGLDEYCNRVEHKEEFEKDMEETNSRQEQTTLIAEHNKELQKEAAEMHLGVKDYKQSIVQNRINFNKSSMWVFTGLSLGSLGLAGWLWYTSSK